MRLNIEQMNKTWVRARPKKTFFCGFKKININSLGWAFSTNITKRSWEETVISWEREHDSILCWFFSTSKIRK